MAKLQKKALTQVLYCLRYKKDNMILKAAYSFCLYKCATQVKLHSMVIAGSIHFYTFITAHLKKTIVQLAFIA